MGIRIFVSEQGNARLELGSQKYEPFLGGFTSADRRFFSTFAIVAAVLIFYFLLVSRYGYTKYENKGNFIKMYLDRFEHQQLLAEYTTNPIISADGVNGLGSGLGLGLGLGLPGLDMSSSFDHIPTHAAFGSNMKFSSPDPRIVDTSSDESGEDLEADNELDLEDDDDNDGSNSKPSNGGGSVIYSKIKSFEASVAEDIKAENESDVSSIWEATV